MNNVIAGHARESAVTALLRLDEEPVSVQDEVLFSCFVVAVGAFLYILDPVPVNTTDVYTLTHPPQAERMNFVMNQAMRWCQQSRTGLAAWMSLDRFQKLMRGAAEATLGDSGGVNWAVSYAMAPQAGLETRCRRGRLPRKCYSISNATYINAPSRSNCSTTASPLFI